MHIGLRHLQYKKNVAQWTCDHSLTPQLNFGLSGNVSWNYLPAMKFGQLRWASKASSKHVYTRGKPDDTPFKHQRTPSITFRFIWEYAYFFCIERYQLINCFSVTLPASFSAAAAALCCSGLLCEQMKALAVTFGLNFVSRETHQSSTINRSSLTADNFQNSTV